MHLCWIYVKHSKAFRFYVIEPNDSVSINSIIESKDAIFDEHRFSSVPRPSQRSLVKGIEDSSGSMVPEKTSDEIVQQSKPQLRKRTMDKDVALWKEVINNEMDSIMGNNTWVLTDLPPGYRPLGCKWIFKIKLKVDGTVEKFKARLGRTDVILGIRIKHESNGIAISQSHYIEKVLKKFNYSDCTPVSTPLDTCEKLMPNRGLAVSQLEYSRVIGCLMYAITCTRLDIAFAVGKLSRYTSNPVLEGYTDASWISNTEDNSSTSGWSLINFSELTPLIPSESNPSEGVSSCGKLTKVSIEPSVCMLLSRLADASGH
ncbi:hypothetical protein Tco_0904425 [Tanacetum coccineum]